MSTTIDLKVEFGGGLELLFGNQRTHALSLPAVVPSTVSVSVSGPSATPTPTPTLTRSTDVTYLIHHLRTYVLKERPELFMEGDTVYVASHPRAPISLTSPPHATHAHTIEKSSGYSGPHQRYGLGVGRRGSVRASRWRRDRVHLDVAWWVDDA